MKKMVLKLIHQRPIRKRSNPLAFETRLKCQGLKSSPGRYKKARRQLRYRAFLFLFYLKIYFTSTDNECDPIPIKVVKVLLELPDAFNESIIELAL